MTGVENQFDSDGDGDSGGGSRGSGSVNDAYSRSSRSRSRKSGNKKSYQPTIKLLGRVRKRKKKKIMPNTNCINSNSNNIDGNDKDNGNYSNRSSRSVRFASDLSSMGCSNKNKDKYSNSAKKGGSDSYSNYNCLNDDVSSLHFDEYGYDARSTTSSRYDDDDDDDDNDEDDDDSVSQFFMAPSKRELSTELFKLMEPNASTSDSLNSLSKLRMWGLVADTDQITIKYLLEYQAVPTLLYFVRDVIEKRRILSMKIKKQQQQQGGTIYAITNFSNNDHHKSEQRLTQTFVDEANNNELSLHQAMQVIYHCTCFGSSENGNSNSNWKNKHKNTNVSVVPNDANTTMTTTTATIAGVVADNDSDSFANGDGVTATKTLSSSPKNVVTQLVETDGIQLLVTVLQEQLQTLAGPHVGSKNAFLCLLKGSESPPKATKDQFIGTANGVMINTTTVGQYSHSVSKSIWLILMNVGTCHKAIKLLKTKQHSHQLRGFIMGIVISLNYRFYVSRLSSNSSGSDAELYHIMSTATTTTEGRSDGNDGGESSWMEDLFVTLCRLVGSKHADCVDNTNGRGKENKGNTTTTTNSRKDKKHINSSNNSSIVIKFDDHDDIRSMLIEKFIVKKCLKLLLDERNCVMGNDSFVTTLAMSFFYACVRFSERYIKISNHNSQNSNNNIRSQHRSAHRIVSKSLDYDRLIGFIMTSMKSFPAHQLIQGTGCLILESIPKPYKLLWMNNNNTTTATAPATAKTSSNNNDHLFIPHRKSIGSLCIKEVIEPCSWYCVIPDN